MEFHDHYLQLIDQIEHTYPVTSWVCEDFEIWPLARTELYLDMYWASIGVRRPQIPSRPFRSAMVAARMVLNLWASRKDFDHLLIRSRPAHAVVLGDGVSLDNSTDGAIDRFAEPIMQALERSGKNSFLMQPGGLSRLPWCRPTYAANLIYHRGAPAEFGRAASIVVPGIAEVADFLASRGVESSSMRVATLMPVASRVSRTAKAFEKLLQSIGPELAFVTNYYSNLGPAFMLACRRLRILSIDLQHCPQSGTHQAYQWARMPPRGYPTLPAVFWNWTQEDAADIQRSMRALMQPWHRSIHGGHTQLMSFLDDGTAANLEWDRQFRRVGDGRRFEKEVLVALQPVGNRTSLWNHLARQIEASPVTWRWWIRRHPASTVEQDREYSQLLSLRLPNVVIDEASLLPLPVLLRHITVLVSLFSGAAAEAAMFGVPALFLGAEAKSRFPDLIARGAAHLVDCGSVIPYVSRLHERIVPQKMAAITIEGALQGLQQMAIDYRRLA